MVRTAVIPAAGYGTRFLPATRTLPKVMLPVLDTPALHLVVQEATEAGVEKVVVVVSHQQEAVSDYFGRLPDVEAAVERRGNAAMLRRMKEIAVMAKVTFVEQPQPLGLGHAVLMARPAVGDEPFAVMLPDDLIWSDRPTIGRMIDVFLRRQASVLAVKEVPDELVSSLGIVDPRPVERDLSQVVGVVEKPALEEAPSRLAIVGRYVLTPEVFVALEKAAPGAHGEIQLTDAIAALLGSQPVYAYRFPGDHFDAGTPLGLLKASIYEALGREDTAPELRRWLRAQPGAPLALGPKGGPPA